MLIEGIIICSYAIGCHDTYIYIRGEYTTQVKVLQAAIDEAYKAGYLGDKVAGRDYKLMSPFIAVPAPMSAARRPPCSNRSRARRASRAASRPFPAVAGLYGCPTIINNVQTIASLPFILENGADAYKAYGTEKSPGTHLFGISGHVEKPGMYELPLGLPLMR
jgi:NADH-quinone oxidoreductase subunit F